jgi:hypothetical protein
MGPFAKTVMPTLLDHILVDCVDIVCIFTKLDVTPAAVLYNAVYYTAVGSRRITYPYTEYSNIVDVCFLDHDFINQTIA